MNSVSFITSLIDAWMRSRHMPFALVFRVMRTSVVSRLLGRVCVDSDKLDSRSLWASRRTNRLGDPADGRCSADLAKFRDLILHNAFLSRRFLNLGEASILISELL